MFFGRSVFFGDEVYELPTMISAQAFPIGDSCADGGELAASLPVLGQTATVRGQQAASGPKVVLLGSPASFPIGLPSGFPCPLWLNSAAPSAILGAPQARTWTINVPVPNDPRLLGGSAMLQSIRVTSAPLSLATTNAVRWVVGR